MSISEIKILISEPFRRDRNLAHWINEKSLTMVVCSLNRWSSYDRPLRIYDNNGIPYFCHLARSADYLFIFEHFLKWGASNHLKDRHGWTPLHYAVWCDNIEAVELLCARESSVDCVDSNGETPLMLAAFKANRRAVDVLLRYGASARVFTPLGGTAGVYSLMVCAQEVEKALVDDFDREVLERKVLGHVCSLNGKTTIANIEVPLEKACPEIMHQRIAHYLETFDCGSWLEMDQKQRIIGAFRRAAIDPLLWLSQFVKMIQREYLIVFPTGWAGHNLDLVFFKEHLTLCNLGEGDDSYPTLYCVRIDPQRMSEAILRRIIEANYSLDIDETIAFLYEELPKLLNPPDAELSDSTTIDMELLSPKESLVGNCCYSGGLGAFACCLRLLSQKENETLKAAFKTFKLHAMKQALHDYEMHRKNSSIPSDEELIKRVCAKVQKREQTLQLLRGSRENGQNF